VGDTGTLSQSRRPVLIFDGDCTFCRFWVARWQLRTGDRVEYQPFQNAEMAARFPDITRDRAAHAVQFVGANGSRSQAAEAVFRLLETAGSPWFLRLYQHVPGVQPITERVYQLIAQHRGLAAKLTTLLWGRDPRPATYALARWWFFRLLGLVYAAAFGSLATQVGGLAGRQGVVPSQLPDALLQAVSVGGLVLAVLMTVGIAPLLMLPLLWGGYLWLTGVCGPFLSFQWDALLLETGFLAILLAPRTLYDSWRKASDPPRLAVSLMLWLLFRLMVGSGAVKLASGDPTWFGLTAMSVHYETQPLPTPVAWYAHQLPASIQRASTAAVLAIELFAPLLIVAPRRLRLAACVLLVGLQAMIASTGNFAFFNLLSASLCVFLLDDVTLRSRSRITQARADATPVRRALVIAAAVLTVPVSVLTFGEHDGCRTARIAVGLSGRQADRTASDCEQLRPVRGDDHHPP
jgi:predicted DCC family thiol-disulfide oxidoreductase YuxK